MEQFSSRNVFGFTFPFGFTFQDVVREFPAKNRVHLARILADMYDKGKLCEINRDSYYIIPFNADPETYAPNGHQKFRF